MTRRAVVQSLQIDGESIRQALSDQGCRRSNLYGWAENCRSLRMQRLPFSFPKPDIGGKSPERPECWSRTGRYCWKQANLAVRPHLSILRSDHRVDVLSVPPSAPRNWPVEFVHLAHVKKDWPVVPSAFVAVQKICNPSDFPSGVMLINCRIDPSVRSAKSSATLVPSGST